jgi:tRNA threonylcarbamoyladenosine biosynthesis protein TsaB
MIDLLEKVNTRDHASVLTVMVDELMSRNRLKMHHLNAVVLSEGPGSYTSLRVGMSTAKGICYGLGVPLIAINTLESMAEGAKQSDSESELICSMVDARRMEVYASVFDRRGNKLLDNQAIILEEGLFDSYLEDYSGILLCGNGSVKAREVFQGQNYRFSDLQHSAKFLVELGFSQYVENNFVDLAYFSPNYIKSPNITKAKKKLL